MYKRRCESRSHSEIRRRGHGGCGGQGKAPLLGGGNEKGGSSPNAARKRAPCSRGRYTQLGIPDRDRRVPDSRGKLVDVRAPCFLIFYVLSLALNDARDVAGEARMEGRLRQSGRGVGVERRAWWSVTVALGLCRRRLTEWAWRRIRNKNRLKKMYSINEFFIIFSFFRKSKMDITTRNDLKMMCYWK